MPTFVLLVWYALITCPYCTIFCTNYGTKSWIIGEKLVNKATMCANNGITDDNIGVICAIIARYVPIIITLDKNVKDWDKYWPKPFYRTGSSILSSTTSLDKLILDKFYTIIGKALENI